MEGSLHIFLSYYLVKVSFLEEVTLRWGYTHWHIFPSNLSILFYTVESFGCRLYLAFYLLPQLLCTLSWKSWGWSLKAASLSFFLREGIDWQCVKQIIISPDVLELRYWSFSSHSHTHTHIYIYISLLIYVKKCSGHCVLSSSNFSLSPQCYSDTWKLQNSFFLWHTIHQIRDITLMF